MRVQSPMNVSGGDDTAARTKSETWWFEEMIEAIVYAHCRACLVCKEIMEAIFAQFYWKLQGCMRNTGCIAEKNKTKHCNPSPHHPKALVGGSDRPRLTWSALGLLSARKDTGISGEWSRSRNGRRMMSD